MSLAVVGAAAATAGRPSVGVRNKERHITPAREPKRVIIYPFNNPKKFTSIFSGQSSSSAENIFFCIHHGSFLIRHFPEFSEKKKQKLHHLRVLLANFKKKRKRAKHFGFSCVTLGKRCWNICYMRMKSNLRVHGRYIRRKFVRVGRWRLALPA
jgi:hypothetical protein